MFLFNQLLAMKLLAYLNSADLKYSSADSEKILGSIKLL